MSNILIMENAKIIFRNFQGLESKFNREGNKNFCLLIEDGALADRLLHDGWNIKTLKPRDEDDEQKYYVQVAVSFDVMPPEVHMITKNNDTILDNESIGVLDSADIITADVSVRPYNWEVNGKSGIKGYLKTLYVTIEENEFADKYRDLNGSTTL